MIQNNFFSVIVLALLLGLRHGIDWDHIAAITDIVGSEDDRKKSFIFSFLYIIGHASVVVLFGLLAVLVGVRLPDWIDTIMEPFVGIT
ncbi:High-affinity nickel-transporter, partial [Candidatus Roizmanbacteria bacterium]|nr:High-affinity nickel-transporter [Candidatus Roizmanbacteria bacterium]